MTTEVAKLIAKYQSKGVLVDANLLLLFFVGTVDRSLIGRFKRTRGFEVEDFELLSRLLAVFKKRIVTPNVLTEVSNLAGQLEGLHRRRVFATIRDAFDLLSVSEQYVPSRAATQRMDFLKYGLTDAALLALADKKMLLLTSDGPLAGYCEFHGLDALNFNHLRFANW